MLAARFCTMRTIQGGESFVNLWASSYRALGWLTIVVAAALLVRLAVVVAATPSDLWLTEFEPIAITQRAPVADHWVEQAAEWISDPAIARALTGDCVAQSVTPNPDIRTRCMDAIDYGLAATPASSELWLAKARLLANQGVLDEKFAVALRNSYSTGTLEGWIASERLPFALRRRAFLPSDLADDIGGDVALVLSNRSLAGPLIQTYIADPFLRDTTWEIIEKYATLDQQEALVDWIRQAL